jgi:hypothetical protein
MKNQRKFLFIEILFFVISIAFIFACSITKTYTALSPEISAKSLEPGQVSLGGSYTVGNNSYTIDNSYNGHYADPNHGSTDFQYYNASGRIGIVKGLDFGIDYSYKNFPKKSIQESYYDNGYDNYYYDFQPKYYQSYWFNIKYQFTNRDMKPGKAMFGIGFTQGFADGYIADKSSINVSSFPIFLGFPINSTDLVQLTTKYEFVDYSADQYTRLALGLGIDVALVKEEKDVIVFKCKPRVGYIIDFADGNDSSSWYFNIGLSFDFKPH